MRARTVVLGAVGVVATLAVVVGVPTLVALAESDVDRQLRDPAITESSGLAVSTRHPGVLYTHNDSDAGPDVYAVGPDGATKAVLTLRGAEARDWEGMSSGPGDTVWVGDIGDNIDGWGTYRVYRFKEPKALTTREVAWTQYDLRYEDGASRDAESLMVHPVTGRVYVATKSLAGPALYEAPAKLSTTEPNVLRRVAKTLSFATDGAFSPNGELYAVRGYVDAKIYRTDEPGKNVASVDLPAQPQGETIAWTADGRALYAGSEGSNSKVYRVGVPSSVTAISAPGAASAGASESPSASPSGGSIEPSGGDPAETDAAGLPREQVWWLAAGAVVLIALGASLRAWSRRDPDEA